MHSRSHVDLGVPSFSLVMHMRKMGKKRYFSTLVCLDVVPGEGKQDSTLGRPDSGLKRGCRLGSCVSDRSLRLTFSCFVLLELVMSKLKVQGGSGVW